MSIKRLAIAFGSAAAALTIGTAAIAADVAIQYHAELFHSQPKESAQQQAAYEQLFEQAALVTLDDYKIGGVALDKSPVKFDNGRDASQGITMTFKTLVSDPAKAPTHIVFVDCKPLTNGKNPASADGTPIKADCSVNLGVAL